MPWKSSTSHTRFLDTNTSFYIIVYLQFLLTPSGIFNIPGCGLLVQWRAQGSLQHAWCGACCTNAHLVILPTLLKTVAVFPCHFCPAQLAMLLRLLCKNSTVMSTRWNCLLIPVCTLKKKSNIIKSCTKWLWSNVNNSAFLDVATPSWSIQEGNQGCSCKGTCKKRWTHPQTKTM